MMLTKTTSGDCTVLWMDQVFYTPTIRRGGNVTSDVSSAMSVKYYFHTNTCIFNLLFCGHIYLSTIAPAVPPHNDLCIASLNTKSNYFRILINSDDINRFARLLYFFFPWGCSTIRNNLTLICRHGLLDKTMLMHAN